MLNRALHLLLARVAVAGEGLLDAVGGQLFDAEVSPCRDEQDDAAGVAHEDGGLRVGVVGVELLDRDDLRLVLGDDRIELALKLNKPLGDRRLDLQANHPGVDESRAQREVIDDAIAGELKAGVDTEDAGGCSR